MEAWVSFGRCRSALADVPYGCRFAARRAVAVTGILVRCVRDLCHVINAAIGNMDGLNDAARELVHAKNIASDLDAELGGWYTLVYERDGRCVAVGALGGTEFDGCTFCLTPKLPAWVTP